MGVQSPPPLHPHCTPSRACHLARACVRFFPPRLLRAAPPQGFGGQAYAQPGFLQQAYSPPQPSPFLQHSMPNMPQGMQLTPMGPQSNMNTMFTGQSGQFQQWQ